jgi:hypothetical protein
MATYRRRAIELEALQWAGDNIVEIVEFCDTCYYSHNNNVPVLMIETLEGTMTASIGDYIIKGIRGEHYACKPEIFNEIYEKI